MAKCGITDEPVPNGPCDKWDMESDGSPMGPCTSKCPDYHDEVELTNIWLSPCSELKCLECEEQMCDKMGIE